MSDARLVWALFVPLIAALVALLMRQVRLSRFGPPQLHKWLELVALVALCEGPVVQGILVATAQGTATILGVTLSLSPVARLGILAPGAAVICTVLLAWSGWERTPTGARSEWVASAGMVTSSLVACAVMSSNSQVAALCLMGVALAVAAPALSRPQVGPGEDEEALGAIARRIAGGLKHLGLAALATGLMLGGLVLMARYAFVLEKGALLQLGLGLFAVGLLARTGAMPFSAPLADLMQEAPGAAILLLGASLPATLVVGLLALAPTEASLVQTSMAAGTGALAAVLAGLRALGAATQARKPSETESVKANALPSLAVMSLALLAGWALFGVLSGTRSGATGAMLLAADAALAAPLLAIASRRSLRATGWQRAGLMVGAGSALGLPPLGGFAGVLQVAQSAANINGLWLALLLLGSTMVAGGWLAWGRSGDQAAECQDRARLLASPARILILVLIAAQVALFAFSIQIADSIAAWANVPWLVGP